MSGKQLLSALLAIFLGSACIAPPAVQAADGEPGAQGPLALYAKAGANKEQLEKIRELGKRFEDEQNMRWQLLSDLQKQMRELSFQPDPDEKTALARQDEINKVIATMANARIKLMLQIRSILNPEQKQRLVELLQPPKQQQTR